MGKWSWLKVAPKQQGNKNTKSHDGKTYHWCTHHARWCHHTSAECKKGQGPKGKKPQPGNGNKPNAALWFAELLEAITDDYEVEQLLRSEPILVLQSILHFQKLAISWL
jgi:hypothetical protein